MMLILLVLLLVCTLLMLTMLSTAKGQNAAADITDYTLQYETLPAEFDGLLIAQVSDYHGDTTCCEQILQSLARRSPDLIAITGDLFDPGVEEVSLDFALQLAAIAPTYFVTGNHEKRVDRYVEMEMRMRSGGVHVLRNEAQTFEKGEAVLRIAGADDPDMGTNPDYAALCADEDFTILLSHRPEHMDQYTGAGAELVLSGHAHGGQFRIPGMDRGLIGHGQKYTQGVHTAENTTLVVSRGIANTYFPPRLFNPPELVYVTLHCRK